MGVISGNLRIDSQRWWGWWYARCHLACEYVARISLCRHFFSTLRCSRIITAIPVFSLQRVWDFVWLSYFLWECYGQRWSQETNWGSFWISGAFSFDFRFILCILGFFNRNRFILGDFNQGPLNTPIAKVNLMMWCVGWFQLGREEPAMSMDSSGKIIWAKHSEIQQANIKALADQEVKDGERLSLAVKDMGSCEIYPQAIAHNPNGRYARFQFQWNWFLVREGTSLHLRQILIWIKVFLFIKMLADGTASYSNIMYVMREYLIEEILCTVAYGKSEGV